MISFLPTPQELHYNGGKFRCSGPLTLEVAPPERGDALLEILTAGFGSVAASFQQSASNDSDETVLVITSDINALHELRELARDGQTEEVRTPTVQREGPYMPDEASLARKLAKQTSVKQAGENDETYFLAVTEKGIAVSGRTRRALFWGAQTLCQILKQCPDGVLPCLKLRDWPVQEFRGLHLDMKYYMPKAGEIDGWLRGMSALKMNVALFEYEDKFPYEKHPFLRHASALTREELSSILETARRYYIEIIPLIQSLGHLEYCLRHQELENLRELPEIFYQICPSNADAKQFVLDMMDEVMAFHPDSQHFHIGGDESIFLGECPRCKEVTDSSGKVGLYLDHIAPLAQHILKRGKRPWLWDDIVRTQAAQAGALPRETVLCYWDYGPVREEHHQRELPEDLQKFYDTDGKEPGLWPDTLSIFPFFDYYRKQGFDVVAFPCLNYGTLIPNDAYCRHNTIKFTQKSMENGGLGVINTQWASFKMPIGASPYGEAITAQCGWSAPPVDTFEFDQNFARVILGQSHSSPLVAAQMAAMGIGFRSPSAIRPLNLLHFAIMDAELHYGEMGADGFKVRMREGTHPQNLDFEKIVRRKLECLAVSEEKEEVVVRLENLIKEMKEALLLAENQTPTTPEGQLLMEHVTAAARFKQTRAASFLLLLGEASPFASSQEAIAAEQRSRAEIEELYGRSLHPAGLSFEIDLLFKGEIAVLEDLTV